jgi:hypothetical protein
MIDREIERTNLETNSTNREEPDRITTADLAATASAPSRAKAREEIEPVNQTGISPPEESIEPLFNENESETFQSRWYGIQSEFVDQPRRSVEQADELVASVIKRLAEVFATERENLEKQFTDNDDVSTEDLRLALRRYRSFFQRLLSV